MISMYHELPRESIIKLYQLCQWSSNMSIKWIDPYHEEIQNADKKMGSNDNLVSDYSLNEDR